MADLQGGSQQVGGDTPHDDADSGAPVKTGGRARTSAIAAAANDDRVDQVMSTDGALLVAGENGGVPTAVSVGATGALDVTGSIVNIVELTTRSTLGDDTANPNISAIAAFGMLWDSVTWDRAPGTSADGALVNLGTNNDVAAAGDIAHDAPDSGSPVKSGGRARTSAITAVINDDRTDQIMSTTGGALGAGSDGGVPRDIAVNASGQIEMDLAAQQLGDLTTQGDVAHDAVDSGNPNSQGGHAVQWASDPPQISTDDDRSRLICTPQGIPFFIPGHPNVIGREYMTTAVQTVDAIIDTVAVGSHIIVFKCTAALSDATTVAVGVRIGFGTTAPPTEPTTGNTVDGMVLSHPGMTAASGLVESPGNCVFVGADGAELRIANDVPTTGQLTVTVAYVIVTL